MCVLLSSKVMKKLTMEPSERISALQALWETQKLADPGPCGTEAAALLGLGGELESCVCLSVCLFMSAIFSVCVFGLYCL